MRVLVYVLATALVAVGVAGGDQPEISLDGDSTQSNFPESVDAAIVTVDSASSDNPSSASSSLALAPSSPTQASQPSTAVGQFKCVYQDGTSDVYTELVNGRGAFFRCMKGTRCFQAPNAPSRIKCDYTSTASAADSLLRLSGQRAQAKASFNALDSGKHYFAQVSVDAEASPDIIPMSTVSLDLPLAGIPTSSEPKIISLNIILPTIAIRITEDPDAPNIATVISIDPIAESTSSSATEGAMTKTLTRIAVETPSPKILTVTAIVTAPAAPASPILSTSVLSITASADMTQFTQSMINRFTSGDDPLLTDKPRHAITINGVELSSVIRQPKPTTTTVYVPASPSTSALSLVGTFFTVPPTQQVPQQRANVLPASVQREYNLPSTFPPPMMTPDPTTTPMVFQGSNFYDPPPPSEEMDVPPATSPAYRPFRQSYPTHSPVSIAPPLSSTQILYPQNTPTVWIPSSRIAAPVTPQPLSPPPQPMPQLSQPMSPPPQLITQPIPQAPQPDAPPPSMITVVMHPNSGLYPIPVSSYPFGMSPLQVAPAPPFNTRAPAPNMLPSVDDIPLVDSTSADSQNTPIIPFITNGARKAAPTNTPQSHPKAKAGDINAHGIVSVLQEVFHIPPSAISIDGTPIAVFDSGAKEGKGAASGGGKNNKHGDDDNDKDGDDDSDNEVQDSGDREHDLESDSRYNIGEIARSRRKIRSKIKAVGRLAKTLTERGGHRDSDEKNSSSSDENGNDDSDSTGQTATATSTSASNSAENVSNISTSMNLASHGAALLSLVMPDTTLSAAIKIVEATDDDSAAPTQSDES
ncbi:hypothetical protein GGI08_001463 [Coemansia sp. S2]|nr:hypothetical protein GGI08_001463 [Coemansia sp. S2]KAJ2345905.1 hypothetical protein GGH92_003848 [Coemansia sp. RSA 2673]